MTTANDDGNPFIRAFLLLVRLLSRRSKSDPVIMAGFELLRRLGGLNSNKKALMNRLTSSFAVVKPQAAQGRGDGI